MVRTSKNQANQSQRFQGLTRAAAAAAADVAAVCPGAVAPEDAILEDDSDLSDGDTLLTAKERKAKAAAHKKSKAAAEKKKKEGEKERKRLEVERRKNEAKERGAPAARGRSGSSVGASVRVVPAPGISGIVGIPKVRTHLKTYDSFRLFVNAPTKQKKDGRGRPRKKVVESDSDSDSGEIDSGPVS